MSELRELGYYLQNLVDDYTAVEAKVREMSTKKGCSPGDLFPLLYDEHWEPLRWKMRHVICSSRRSLEPWVDEEIENTFQKIGYAPIRRELEEIWRAFESRAMEKEAKPIKRKGARSNLKNAEILGAVMSEKQRKRACTWMLLQEGEPEDIQWADAVMAVWEEEISELVLPARAQQSLQSADGRGQGEE